MASSATMPSDCSLSPPSAMSQLISVDENFRDSFLPTRAISSGVAGRPRGLRATSQDFASSKAGRAFLDVLAGAMVDFSDPRREVAIFPKELRQGHRVRHRRRKSSEFSFTWITSGRLPVMRDDRLGLQWGNWQ